MATRPHLWYLQRINIFAGVTKRQFEEITAHSKNAEIKKNTIIYSTRDPLEKIYILKEGEVVLYKSYNGRKIIIDVLKPGSVFGALSCVQKTSGHYALTSENSLVCTILRKNFLHILEQYPEIAMKVICLFSEKMREYEEKIRDLSILDARQRILHALHHISETEQKDILPEGLKKRTRLTHEKLAQITGLTRETTTKILLQLKKEGAVKEEKGKILTLSKKFIL